MRVLFLTLYPDQAASPRYRVAQFLPYLRENGIDCHCMAPLSEAQWRRHTGPTRQGRAFWYHRYESPQRIKQILQARRYDVVFLQKALMSAYLRGMAGLLRHCAPSLIYDIDDAVHLQPPHPLPFPWKLMEDKTQVRKIMRQAKRVLAGNAWLQEAAEQEGAKADFFPTVVDTERFHPATQGPEEPFRIGWIGTPSTTPAIRPLCPIAEALPDASLQLVGADPKIVHCEAAKIIPWRYDKEVEAVQTFSVGVMPLEKNTWSKGKCALKALIYMACGVPCIATPHGAIRQIIQHGENGFLADSEAEWRQYLDQLRDPALAKRIGEAGRATVETNFSLHKAAPELLAILEGAR